MRNYLVKLLFLQIFIYLSQCAIANSTNKIFTKNLIVSIEIRGLDEQMTNIVKQNLSLVQNKEYASKSEDNFKFLFQKSIEEIKNTLVPYGYYNPTIKIQLIQDLNQWNVIFDIDPGKPMIISKIKLSIVGDQKNDEYFQQSSINLSIKKNMILTQKKYENSKSQLLNLAFQRGFLNNKLTEHIIKINTAKNRATVILTLKLGKRYKIGNIKINQKGYKFNTNFIKRYLNFKSNDYFNSTNITKSQTQLQNSPYFKSATISATPNSKGESVPILINLSSKKPITYTVGGGWGSYTGPRVLGGVIFRHLNDIGHYAEFNIEASQVNTTFLGQYVIPGADPSSDYWSINTQQSTIDTIPYTNQESSVGINKIITNKSFKNNIGLHLTFMRFNTQANSSNLIKHYFLPSWQIMYKYLKQSGYWNSGIKINNSLQFGIKQIGSSNTFLKNMTVLEYSLPLMNNWNRLVLKNNFGIIVSKNFNALAAPIKFYAGGIGNLLGYQYLSQGPTNNAGDLIGGKYLITSAVAFEQKVYKNISILNYINAGNAMNSLKISNENIKYAAGIGLAYKSPLGPLQFFLTRSLNHNDRHWRFDFSLGIFLS